MVNNVKIEAKNIIKQYSQGNRNIEVLKNVNLSIISGDFICITGHSGSGKSTLLNIIAGLIKPSAGYVLLDGQDIFTFPDEKLSYFRNTRVGCVPQGYSTLSNFTVLDNVRLPFFLARRDGDPTEEAMKLLKLFQIEKLADSLPKCLSGGELKRVAIARAMMNRPDFLLVDEPTGDLDAPLAKIIMGIFRKIADDGGTVLMTTHELDTKEYVNKIYKMAEGTCLLG
jgi:putative ABC transport system ATP-binding protein